MSEEVACDRLKKRAPAQCHAAVFEAFCDCGRVFRRCSNHGGVDGANKSRGSHRGLNCSARGRSVAAEHTTDQPHE